MLLLVRFVVILVLQHFLHIHMTAMLAFHTFAIVSNVQGTIC